MSIVKAKPLGDLITLKRGYDLPEKNRTEGPFPVISSAGVSGCHNEFKVEGEGVVTGRYGTLGQMYYIDGKYWPHNTALYVQDFKGNDPKYIYYLLSCIGRIRTSDKSAVPGVNRNELHDMAVPAIADKNTQIAVRKLLWSIDSKIELNNQINTDLEAMTKLIYDYWFVQFDFPDANGKPYKSSGGKMVYNEALKRDIPDGWVAGNCASLFEFNPTLSIKKVW
jgi:type I restriction enzyme S subunit